MERKEAIHQCTPFFFGHNLERQAKWTISPCVQIDLVRILTRLHAAQHLFLHHIIITSL